MGSATADPDDVRRVIERITQVFPKSEWPPRREGWPGQIELAILDSIFSLRARYGGPTSGVRGLVQTWRDHRNVAVCDDVEALSAYVDRADELAGILSNRQVLSGGHLKAKGAAEVAKTLACVGVRHAADVTGEDEQRRAWSSVPGLGWVSWSYFLMLLGNPGVKADVMVTRFVTATLGRPVSPAEAHAIVTAAAPSLTNDLTALDQAIWSWQRSQG